MTWSYQFPDATGRAIQELGSAEVELQIRRIGVEVEEALRAFANEPDWRVASELMDVIHATETAIRLMDMPVEELGRVRQGVIAKNAERGYY